MRADKQLLNGVVGAVRHISVGHPFDSETWPCKCMGVEGVVEEGRVFLPYLVLLHGSLLFDLVGVFDY